MKKVRLNKVVSNDDDIDEVYEKLNVREKELGDVETIEQLLGIIEDQLQGDGIDVEFVWFENGAGTAWYNIKKKEKNT